MTDRWIQEIAARVTPAIAAEIRSISHVDALVAAVIARGSAAHADLPVTQESWIAFFAAQLRPAEVAAQLEQLHAEDVHLILACLDEALPTRTKAQADLDARLSASARQAFAGKRLSPEDQDEVLQTVRAKMFVGDSGRGKIAGYSGRGPLDGWLRVALSNEAISKLRAQAASTNRLDDSEALERAGADDPELSILRAKYGAALKRALEESLAALDPDERTLVREHYLEGLTIDDLAAVYDTHRATAARRLARARNKIFEGGRRRLMDALGVGDTEFQSLLGALVSGLDWTIRAALDGARQASSPELPVVEEPNDEDEEPSFAELGVAVVVAQRFELTRFLGSGGTAVVWSARRLTVEVGDDEEVALKFSRSDAPEFALRFEREAVIAMSLVHPSIVCTFEVLPATRGRGPCLVQELVRGETLETRLARLNKLPIKEAAQMAIPIAEALVTAHAKGIVHRDLKPQNVMVSTDTNETATRVVVLDFGIAKLLSSFGEHARLTRSGAVMGTPRYMAPEQLASEKDIDARADIWSFGALMFRMLSGRAPIDANTTGEMWKALQAGNLPQLESLEPNVPSDICARVHEALELKRSRRADSLAPFLETLRKYA